MGAELATAGMAGFSDAPVAGALEALLTLTTDAVLIFDASGTILVQNDSASRLFATSEQALVGTDVRTLFVAVPHAKGAPFESTLPFSCDGSHSELTSVGTRMGVAAERLPGGRYLLVAHAQAPLDVARLERERLVEELTRANKRLAGTLKIVLGTLDSLDVGALVKGILDEVASTLDAWGAVAYLAEADGYRLRGATDALATAPRASVPKRLDESHPLVRLVAREERTVRLAVRPITRDQLRSGDAALRVVEDVRTGELIEVASVALVPFASLMAVPVWFAGHMLAVLIVGWRHAHTLRVDDARLLDAVAEYLSVQLAGAFASFQAQHAERLESTGTTLRERLLSGDPVDAALTDEVFGEAASALDARLVPLAGNVYQRTTIARFERFSALSVGVDLKALARTAGVPSVVPVEEAPGLVEWLQGVGLPTSGLIASLGEVEGAYVAYVLVRDEEAGPFEDIDLSFVRRLAEDVFEVAAGERARSRDTRIAEALQQGMRNELQRVEGLSAESRYSSATEAAYVGGDFYDLIRLPEHRACVVMGDVSGKGVEAASVSAAVKTAISAYAWEGLAPARMVGLLNDFLLGFSRIETFATMFVGVVDLASAHLTYCSAGHPPALLVRAATGELCDLGVQSGVVGAFSGMRYVDGEVDLEQGDVLVLYTDGVTEARNPEGGFFGEDGLRDACAREVALGFEGLAERMLASVAAFSGGSLEDDVAIVTLRLDEPSGS